MPPQGLCSFLPAVASARTIDEHGNGLALLVLLFNVCVCAISKGGWGGNFNFNEFYIWL